jgi:predicted nucleic acid-binding protein
MTRHSKFVLDASVALKWQLNDEECVSQAVALRDDALKHSAEICVPTLWLYEIINGLVMASRRGRFPSAEVSQAMSDLLAVGISMRTPDPQRVSALALAHEITAYDSAYLALAEQEGCDLWTGDLSLYRAVSKKLRWVRWIGDYTSIL